VSRGVLWEMLLCWAVLLITRFGSRERVWERGVCSAGISQGFMYAGK
jgi:hypothetical protein